ncbi:MAG: leucine-rich repeat protein [Paludibacteraceae bacterium]|nr:leucine-rich repeat protein [Paludibacteraceae bacterium]
MKWHLFLLLIFVGFSNVRAFDFYSDGFYFKVDDNSASVVFVDTVFFMNKQTIEFPEKIKYNGKTLVVDKIFKISPCRNIKKVIIHKYVRKIGPFAFAHHDFERVIINSDTLEIYEGAFISCKKLKSVSINGFISKIGESAFAGCCSLEKFRTKNIQKVCNHSFSRCVGLMKFKVPDGVDTFNLLSLYDCKNLKYLYIPKTTKTIFPSTGVFNLRKIIVNKNNSYYKSINGVLYTKDEKTIVLYPNMKKRNHYAILSNTQNIGSLCFYNLRKLTKIYLPDSLERIEPFAFYYNKELKEVVLPSKEIVFEDMTLLGKKYKKNIFLDDTLETKKIFGKDVKIVVKNE